MAGRACCRERLWSFKSAGSQKLLPRRHRGTEKLFLGGAAAGFSRPASGFRLATGCRASAAGVSIGPGFGGGFDSLDNLSGADFGGAERGADGAGDFGEAIVVGGLGLARHAK